MRLPPLEVIAHWPKPNYEHPITRGPSNIIFNSILFPIVSILIGIRVFTRLRISKSFGVDDWLIVAAVFPTGIFSALTLATEMDLGWNKHVWDLNISEIRMVNMGLKLTMIAQVMFGVATTLIKCSMLALTYRILTSGSSRLRPWIIVVMVTIILEGISFCCVVVFQCSPISEYWRLSSAEQSCIDEPRNLLAAGIINTCTDFIVVVLPIPTVLGVKIRPRDTIVLVLLFTAGFLATSAGAARTYFTHKVTASNDKTWDIFYTWLSSSVELYTGLICASIPTTKQFFTRHLPHLIRTGRWPHTAYTNSIYFASTNASFINSAPFSIGAFEDTIMSHESVVLDKIVTEPPRVHIDIKV